MAGHGRKLYRIHLTDDEREQLKQLVRVGRAAGWKLQRAQCILKFDQAEEAPAWKDADIAEAFDVSVRSLENWRRQAAERGPLSLLERKAQDRSKFAKLDGNGEAELVRLACSTPPEGRACWTLSLLAHELTVCLDDLESISRETVRQYLSKTS